VGGRGEERIYNFICRVGGTGEERNEGRTKRLDR
jgi:hypothetical protein